KYVAKLAWQKSKHLFAKRAAKEVQKESAKRGAKEITQKSAKGVAKELQKPQKTIGKREGKVVKESKKSSIKTTQHGVSRKIERQIRSIDEIDAMKNPLKIGEIKIDSFGRPSQRYIGKNAEVVINPQNRKIISVNPTSSVKREKLLKKIIE
ncbi:MAG: hypothetical protein ACRCUQ_01290, partial [Alphaproteobacteria bacterium]